MSLKIVPLGDRIVIDPITTEITSGGILLPESARKQNIGVVVAVGSGTYEGELWRPLEPIKGNTVVYEDRHNGETVTVDNKEYLVLHEYDIICILK